MDLAALGSRKARALLRLLALGRGRPVEIDVLVNALWHGHLPARPAEQLAVLVSRLRAVIGRDRITHDDGGYRLRYDWLDVDAVESLEVIAGEWVPFVHNYYANPRDTDHVIAESVYGRAIPAIAREGSVVVTQFHPDKSGGVGPRLLENARAEVARGVAAR